MKRRFILFPVAVISAAAAVAVYVARREEVPPSPAIPPRAQRAPVAPSSPFHRLTDPALPLHERLELVKSVPAGFQGEDAAIFRSLLRHHPSAADEGEWWVVLNELLTELRSKSASPDAYGENLISLIGDAGADGVARDYAVQHLVGWIVPEMSGRPATSGGADLEQRRSALAAIVGAVRDPSLAATTVPGTGLLALAHAGESLDAAEMQPVWQQLAGFLDGVIRGSTPVDPSARNAAIQAVARSRQGDFLPLLRDLAGDEGTAPSLALAAIHALGTFGLPEDRPLLTSFASSQGPLRFAARSALDRMTALPSSDE